MGNIVRPEVEIEFRHNGERLLRLLQKQHPEYHPILRIAKIAHDAETSGGGPDGDQPNHELALKAHTTILRYVEPELKSVEVKVENKNARVIEVSLFQEDRPVRDLANEAAQKLVIDVEVETSQEESST